MGKRQRLRAIRFMRHTERYPSGKKITESAREKVRTQEWIDKGFSPSGLMIATRERVMGKVKVVKR